MGTLAQMEHAVHTDSVLDTCSVCLTDKDTKPEWPSNFMEIKYLVESSGGVYVATLSDIKHSDFLGLRVSEEQGW